LYEFIKTRIKIKDYYPPINAMIADNGKIYVLTNKMKKGAAGVYCYGFEGGMRKRGLTYRYRNYMGWIFISFLQLRIITYINSKKISMMTPGNYTK